MLQFGTSVDIFTIQRDGDLLRLAALRIEFVEITAMLIDNHLTIRAGELYVIVGVIGHLFGFASLGVVDKQVHGHIPIRREKDLVANPHRKDILSLVVRDIGHLLGCRIVDPDVVGHTATIIFPVAEFTEGPVISQLFAIGRVRAEATFGQRQRLRHSTLFGNTPQFA